MKVLLLEDEDFTREFFVKILQEIPEVKEIIATSSGAEIISLAHKEEPDLILLDIELDNQNMNGLQVARELFENNQDTFIVFITGYAKYALESFDVHPYDYILKPVNKSRMVKLIEEIAVKNNSTLNLKPLKISFEKKIYLLDPSEVIFIEKYNNISYVHTTTEIYKTYQTLQELQDLLENAIFFRAHKSYLINYEYIDKIKVNPNRTYQVKFKEYSKLALMSRQGYKEYKMFNF